MSGKVAPSSEFTSVEQALRAFLKSPPAGTPPEFLASINRMADTSGTLPPHIFQEVVEQTPVAVSITDRDANIMYVNQAFERLTGYGRRDVIGDNESVLSNGATPKEVYKSLWKAISRKEIWKGIIVNRRKDGSEYLADLTIAPVLDANGEISHFLGMHHDISDKHQLEVKQGYNEALLASVVNAAPILVMLVDTEQKVILDNAQSARLRRELGGREPFALFRDALSEQAEVDLEFTCKQGQAFRNQEIRVEIAPNPSAPAEPRWFSCSGTWVCEMEDEVSSYFSEPEFARPCLLLLANDVTEKKRDVERARLNHLRASLAEQKLSLVMRETLEAAVFQLRGPLNMIDAALRMIDQGGGDPVALQKMLQEINSIGRATLAQMESALPDTDWEPETSVNINELLQEVIQLSTERLLSAGIVVDWRPQAVLPSIAGRTKELRALFMNLVDNAIRALELTKTPYREIRLATSRLDNVLLVEVMDNGIGVDEEIGSRIFEPFYSNWRQRERHAGMGLTLAREIAGRHGGGVYLDPDFLGGSRIRVELAI